MILHLCICRVSKVAEVTFLVAAGSVCEYIGSSNLWLAVLTSLRVVQIKHLNTIMLKLKSDYFHLYEWIKMRNLREVVLWVGIGGHSEKLLKKNTCIWCVFGLEVCVLSSLEKLSKNQQKNCTIFLHKSVRSIYAIILYSGYSMSFYDNSIYTDLGCYCSLARFVLYCFIYCRLTDLMNSQHRV